MCEINWQLLLEYLKVVLSWPPIALVISFAFITRFRKSINDFLNRVIEGNIFGQTLKAAPPRQSQDSVGAMEDKLAIAAEAQPRVGALNVEASSLPPQFANDPQAQLALDYVKRNPVQTVIEYKRLFFSYTCERLFHVIYGTQIALLEFLASRPTEHVTLAQLAQFHQEHQLKVARIDYQLRDYMDFLVNQGLLSVEGPLNQQTFAISQHGVEFLSYIKANYPTAWNQRAY